MATPMPPGAPRQSPRQTHNPSFPQKPDSLSDNLQKLNLNMPSSLPNSAATLPPFIRSPSTSSNSAPSPPISRPGAPPPGAVLRPNAPPNVGLGMPFGPPGGQPLPFGTRPPPGFLPSSMGGGPVITPGGSSAPGLGAPPSPYSAFGGPIRNGPSVGVPPAMIGTVRSPGQASSMRPFLGSSQISHQPGPPLNSPMPFSTPLAAPLGTQTRPPGQCALLYTTVYGQRRIRVSTNLFRATDMDAQFVCSLKQALTKSAGLRIDGRIDYRSFWISYVSHSSTPSAIFFLLQRMIAIHNLDPEEENGLAIPQMLPLSSEYLSEEGIYLLENRLDGLIYIGSWVDSDVLRQLFGISSVDETPTQFVLEQYDNPLSRKLNRVVNEIRRQWCSYLRWTLCKKGHPSGLLFFSNLVEDQNQKAGQSYSEFLAYLHWNIQSKMS